MDLARPILNLWAKTGGSGEHKNKTWHPLILHLLDIAACIDYILVREPESTRARISQYFDLDWEQARPWLLLVTSCHDLGKACPGFQRKWTDGPSSGLEEPRSPDTKINHGFVSQIALEELLRENGWSDNLAILVADAVGCHHGERASPTVLSNLEGNSRAMGGCEWTDARRELYKALKGVFRPTAIPTNTILSGSGFMILAGLTSFADWIGSNEDWFPFGTVEDCHDLQSWFEKRRTIAEKALDSIGWLARTPLSPILKSFENVFGFPARPMQQIIVDALSEMREPGILLIEAPMGEGKTEAAFYAHLELQRRFGHRGLYVALPTQATGNAMFERTLAFLQLHGSGRMLDLQLLHGATLLNDTFQNLRISGIHDSDRDGEIRASEWFTHKKRALLSEYGVGTVDQALLPILPVRHNFVRLWGLANRVVIFDEIHAYDAYTGTLLIHLLRWLLALGSSVILLSATLPPSIRRKIANAIGKQLPEMEREYPRLSLLSTGATMTQRHFEADPTRCRAIQLRRLSHELSDMRASLEEHLRNRGMGLALVNTVQRAQDLYVSFPDGAPIEREGRRVGKRLLDGTEIFLLHARFSANDRREREDQAIETYGRHGNRDGRKILIATQVVEQSLDLDFDFIVTDLAPIDLVLQRAGRLWRHSRGERPVSQPVLAVAGLAADKPPSFGEPLWWNAVYREDILLRTWCILRKNEEKDRNGLIFPDELDTLVQAVYEEQVAVPDFLEERLAEALIRGEGESFSMSGQANQAIIGFPDDASWDNPSRFTLYDEDDPRVHQTLMARTRLSENSLTAIPLLPTDAFSSEITPNFPIVKHWFMRAVSLSRRNIVEKLKETGVPDGWKKSPLLRNCYPLILDGRGRWKEDARVCMDEDLGIVYRSKEEA